MKEYRKDDWISSKVEIRASITHSKGMFAVAPMEQGEVVAVWGGRFVNRAEADMVRLAGKAVQQIEEDVFEVFDYDKRGDDPTYYHNHSCDPNTWMRDEVTIIARRDIQRGEELTIDYAMFEANEDCIMPMECKCGAPGCRKQITGKDWRLSEIQERYRNHFSPLIGRRIALKRIVSSE